MKVKISTGTKVLLVLIALVILITSSFLAGMFLFNNNRGAQTVSDDTTSEFDVEQDMDDFWVSMYCEDRYKLQGTEYTEWLYSAEGDLCIEALSKNGQEDYKQYQIDKCQYNAAQTLSDIWISYCRTNKIKITTTEAGYETCEIPVDQANIFTDQLQKDKEMCITRYK